MSGIDLFGEDIQEEPDTLQEDPESLEAPESVVFNAPGQTLPAPRLNPDLIAHEPIKTYFLNRIQDQDLPHALVLAGQKGIGKATFAFAIARLLFHRAKSPDFLDFQVPLDSQAFRQVASGGHPDLLTIERERDSGTGQEKGGLGVDQLRQVTPFLRMKPAYDNGWRIVIIDDADTMNRAAQNALLKILEEPPPKSLLILVAHQPGKLIPTIRSRTHFLSFAPLSEEQVSSLVKRSYPDLPDQDVHALSVYGAGSAGLAISAYENKITEMMKDLESLLLPWPDVDMAAVHRLAERLARPGQNADGFRQSLAWIIAGVLGHCVNKAGRPAVPVVESLANKAPLQRWLGIYDALETHFRKCEHQHLDTKFMVLNAFFILMGQDQTT